MDKVKVSIYQRQRKIKITDDLKRLIKVAAETALICEGREGYFEVTVTIVNNCQIRDINNDCRGIDSPTDVLSFPLSNDGIDFDINPITNRQMLGDIVISAERANEQAYEFGQPFQREVAFLTVHSMLHLLGYDHVNSEAEEAVMRSRQRVIMAELEKRCDEVKLFIGKRELTDE